MTAKLLAYVGSRATRERNARGEGISIFAVDRDTGAGSAAGRRGAGEPLVPCAEPRRQPAVLRARRPAGGERLSCSRRRRAVAPESRVLPGPQPGAPGPGPARA